MTTEGVAAVTDYQALLDSDCSLDDRLPRRACLPRSGEAVVVRAIWSSDDESFGHRDATESTRLQTRGLGRAGRPTRQRLQSAAGATAVAAVYDDSASEGDTSDGEEVPHAGRRRGARAADFVCRDPSRGARQLDKSRLCRTRKVR